MQTQPTPLELRAAAGSTDPCRRRLLAGAGAVLVSGLAGMLAGCGGGSMDSGDGAPQPQIQGVDSGGTGRRMNSFIKAALDSVGPAMVGTLRIDLQNSSLTGADGQILAASVLQPGMTVQVLAAPLVGEGSVQVARASSVQLAEQLLGPVTALAPAAAPGGGPAGFMLLGQSVVLTARTVIDPALGADAGSLVSGMVLRVWGELDAAGGRIVASRVDLPPSDARHQVRGLLSALDLAQGRAGIGGLAVQTTPEQLARWAAGLALGQVVRASVEAAAPGQPVVLLALRADALVLPDELQVELEGRLGLSPGAMRLLVDGVAVDLSGLTADAAAAAAALPTGSRVVARGRSVGGLLLAQSVAAESDDADPVTELEGTISSANPAGRSFVLRGLTVLWGADTRIIGGPVSLIAARRKAAVKGRLSADRLSLQASIIHVER